MSPDLHHAEQQMLMLRPWEAAEPESLFVFVGALAEVSRPIDPAWIIHARPLLLVYRDDPSTPYWDEDRVWMRGEAS